MSKMTVRHDCGHKSVIDVGDGPAHDKAARVFEATLQNCPACREHEESDEGFAISQNTRIEQEEAGVISLPTKRQQQRQPRQPRQSREAQRNARIHQAFLTLREVACRDGHANGARRAIPNAIRSYLLSLTDLPHTPTCDVYNS